MHLPLFWKFHCATCSPVYVILYHVVRSCKRPIGNLQTLRHISFDIQICQPLNNSIFKHFVCIEADLGGGAGLRG